MIPEESKKNSYMSSSFFNILHSLGILGTLFPEFMTLVGFPWNKSSKNCAFERNRSMRYHLPKVGKSAMMYLTWEWKVLVGRGHHVVWKNTNSDIIAVSWLRRNSRSKLSLQLPHYLYPQTLYKYGFLILAIIAIFTFPHNNERSEMKRKPSHKYPTGRHLRLSVKSFVKKNSSFSASCLFRLFCWESIPKIRTK